MGTFLLVAGDFVRTGGMDMANYALAQHLAERNHVVHLVSHRVAPDLARLPHVHVHRVPKPASSYLLGEPLLSAAGRWWASRLSPHGARVVTNGGNCPWHDVNWVHYVHAAYDGAPRSQRLRRIKDVLKHPRALGRERRAISKARVVIANSMRTRR